MRQVLPQCATILINAVIGISIIFMQSCQSDPAINALDQYEQVIEKWEHKKKSGIIITDSLMQLQKEIEMTGIYTDANIHERSMDAKHRQRAALLQQRMYHLVMPQIIIK